MAKVNIVYDSVEKSLVVDVDGVAQPNISSIVIYNYGDEEGEQESHIELIKVTKDEGNDMVERTSLYASHTENIKEPRLNLGQLSENFGNSLRKR